jgi:hypothetical protein
MPAKDIFHSVVRAALIKDGWTITHDPLPLTLGEKNLYIDFGAERLLAAERAGNRIAVEIKSFVGSSELHDLEEALGQFLLYRAILEDADAERALYLAVEHEVLCDLFESEIGLLVRDKFQLRMLSFDAEQGTVVQWID